MPLRSPADVIPHLGRPTHWRQGRSAKAVADSWFAANGLPGSVRSLLEQAPEYIGAELLDAWLERSTDLGDRRQSHSQTDVLGILGAKAGIAILGVEAKVTETFGPFVDEWLQDGGDGKAARLAHLQQMLGMSHCDLGDLRYQLLHRMAAVLIEAHRYRTAQAVMLVQSFCPNATGFDDFARFCQRLGYPQCAAGLITDTKTIDGVSLRVGWVADQVPD